MTFKSAGSLRRMIQAFDVRSFVATTSNSLIKGGICLPALFFLKLKYKGRSLILSKNKSGPFFAPPIPDRDEPGRKRKRYLRVAAASALFLGLALHPLAEIRAASFDCDKARSAVEKMICADAELSKFDEEMVKTYEQALPKAPDSSVVKQQQKDWLKERDLCEDRSCLSDQYQLRIGELQRIVDLIPLAGTEESHFFETESAKVKVIQDVVRRQNFIWYHPYMKEPEYCTEFKKDFIKGQYLEAVEPDFRTDDPDDPRFEELNRCTDPKVHPEKSFEGEFYGVENIGGPPFRYYNLEIDNDPTNGKEHILYSEPTATESGTGYVWIDSDICLVKEGAIQGGFNRDISRNTYRFTSLAKYKGELIMVGINPSFKSQHQVVYRFSVWRFDKSQDPPGCIFDFN